MDEKKSQTKKILIFYRSLAHGGVQKMMLNLSNYLVNHAYEVTVLLLDSKGVLVSQLNNKIVVVEVPSKGIKRILFLGKYIKRMNFDLVFTATGGLNITAIIAKILFNLNAKVIISERSNTFLEFKSQKSVLHKITFLLVPLLYRFSDGIIAVSEGVAKNLSRFALIKKRKITVIYNPAFDDQNRIDFDETIDYPWFSHYGGTSLVISAGRFVPQKNFSLLVKAASHLNKTREIKLLLLGDGDEKENLVREIERLDASSFIRIESFKQNPILWISKADVFVMTSLWEGFGNILVDALAAGTTIVSTNCPDGPGEILGDGKFGYLLNNYDYDELAKSISFAIDNPMNKDLLRRRAEDFSKSIILQKYVTLFELLMRY